MNIVQFIEVVIPAGTTSILAELSRALVSEGHSVTVLIARSGAHNDPLILQRLQQSGCNVVQLGWMTNPYAVPNFWALARRTRAALQSLKPDVVHVHSYYAEQAVHFARYRGAPIIVTLHTDSPNLGGSAPQHRVRDGLARKFYLRPDVHLVSVSAYLASRISQTFRLGPKQVQVIHNALSKEWFDQDPLPCVRDIDILQVGRVDENKNQIYTARILAELARRGRSFKAVIAGDGPLLPALQEVIAQAGLSGKVCSPGRAHDARGLFRRARIALTTSKYEAFGMVAIEALASGAACVASDIAAHREVLNGGKFGLLLPHGDHNCWAEELGDLLDDPGRLQRLQLCGREYAEANFSSSRFLASYKALYRQVLR